MLRLAQQLSRMPIVGFMVKSGIIDERNLDEFPLQYMLRSGNKVGPQPVLGVNMQIARGMV